jgi:hypothetical protein
MTKKKKRCNETINKPKNVPDWNKQRKMKFEQNKHYEKIYTFSQNMELLVFQSLESEAAVLILSKLEQLQTKAQLGYKSVDILVLSIHPLKDLNLKHSLSVRGSVRLKCRPIIPDTR